MALVRLVHTSYSRIRIDIRHFRRDTTAIRAKWLTEQTGHQPRNEQQTQPRGPPVKGKPSKLRNFLLLTPWSSIVSWAFLATGLVTYVINAPKLNNLTRSLLEGVNGDQNLTYISRLETLLSSHVISGILGLVSIVVGGIAAYIHIKHVVNGPFWGGLHRTFLTSTLLLGLLYLVACVAWFVILMNYVSSWMTALWTFQQGASLAADALVAAGASGVAGDGLECVDGCFSLASYPFLGTNGCICNAETAAQAASVASMARGKGMWVLVGVVAVCVGLIHSVVNVAADMGGTWVKINAEIVNCVMYEKGADDGDSQRGWDDSSVSGVSSAVNTTPATHTKEYVKSRLGSIAAVPGHVALGGNGANSGVVFSSNV